MKRLVLLVFPLALACDKTCPDAATAQPCEPCNDAAGSAVVAESTSESTSESKSDPAPAPDSASYPMAQPVDGATRFFVYEGFLSPAQEGGEETEAPKIAKNLQSTAPSTERAKRGSRGYGQLRIARDLSKAYIEVQMEGVKAEDIVMFHIHCGPPGVLGPIIVDIGAATDLGTAFADGHEVVEIDNDNIVVQNHAHGLKPSLPEGCPVDKGFLTGVKTIGGLDYLARKDALYFNLHTKAHTYYGEMRGQIYMADD